MNEEENERDFMKACFNVVAGLEVKNETQAIAKEVILDEIENLTKENNQLKDRIEKAIEYIEYIGMDATFDKVLIEILKGGNDEK